MVVIEDIVCEHPKQSRDQHEQQERVVDWLRHDWLIWKPSEWDLSDPYAEHLQPAPPPDRSKVDPELERWFREKVDTWRRETGGYSVIRKKISHIAYEEIVDRGWDVVPLILAEMRNRPGYWFWALRSITDENPVREGATFTQATEDWISWGIQRHLIV